MTPLTEFVMLQCSNEACRFRCPSNLSHGSLEFCPLCGSPIHAIGKLFTNQKVRLESPSVNQTKLDVLLDNLRSTLNVGSIFRTADGAGVNKIHLCGTTPTPEHPKMAKTGLGAEIQIPWQYHRNGLDLVKNLQSQGVRVIALEAAPQSVSLFSARTFPHPVGSSTLLVIGNEISGVDPLILETADVILSIPMRGVKSSLNVAVAFGIAVYTIRESQFME